MPPFDVPLPYEAISSLTDLQYPFLGCSATKKKKKNFNEKLETSASNSPILDAYDTKDCFMQTNMFGQSPKALLALL